MLDDSSVALEHRNFQRTEDSCGGREGFTIPGWSRKAAATLVRMGPAQVLS